jgi:hypothetical protein
MHAGGEVGGEMIELRTSADELVERARAAGDAGKKYFQVFVQHEPGTSTENDRDAEFDVARLVDLLEGTGWTLENVATAGEREAEWAYGVQTATAIGTIYTFRAGRP